MMPGDNRLFFGKLNVSIFRYEPARWLFIPGCELFQCKANQDTCKIILSGGCRLVFTESSRKSEKNESDCT